MVFNLPNILTISRICVIPLIVAFCLIGAPVWEMCALILFICAGLTDYLDGYFARILHMDSSFGRFLDPIADKLLVASLLLTLTSLGRIYFLHLIPALIILCREILVSGLREHLAEIQKTVPVSYGAKWKTSIQMVALGFLILSPTTIAPITSYIGLCGLWLAALLTLSTGCAYLKQSIKFFR